MNPYPALMVSILRPLPHAPPPCPWHFSSTTGHSCSLARHHTSWPPLSDPYSLRSPPGVPLDLHRPTQHPAAGNMATISRSPCGSHLTSSTPKHSMPSTQDAATPLPTPNNMPPGPFPFGHDSDPPLATALSRLLPSIADHTLFDQFTTVGWNGTCQPRS